MVWWLGLRTDGTSAAAVCHFLSHSALPLSLPSLPRSLPLQRPAVVVVRRADLLVRSRFLPPSFPPGPRSADCRAGLRCDSLSNPPKRTPPPPPPPPPRFLTSSRSSSVRRRASARPPARPPPRESSYLYFWQLASKRSKPQYVTNVTIIPD